MRYRAPKLTARTFYAPLNERSPFDGLRKTARLIGKNVRGQQFIISTLLHREAGTRRGVAFEPLCVPSERGAPRGVGQSNRKDASLFFFFPHLKPK